MEMTGVDRLAAGDFSRPLSRRINELALVFDGQQDGTHRRVRVEHDVLRQHEFA